MSKNLFINNSQTLVQYEKITFNNSNKVILTDLHKVQQVQLDLHDTVNTINFVVQNMESDSNKLSQYLSTIEKSCQLKRIIMQKNEFRKLVSSFDLSINNKAEDKFWNTINNDKNSELYEKVFSIYNSILSILKDIDLSPENKKYLEDNNIIFDNDYLIINSNTNTSAVKCKMVGAEKSFVYFENHSHEREKYIEELKKIQAQIRANDLL